MNSDCHFWIGSTHSVCQDYCLSGMLSNDKPYAIVCDGCSSSPDTDFGARVLAYAAENTLYDENFDEPMNSTKFAIQTLGLANTMIMSSRRDPNCLDATLLVATPEVVRCYGDGTIALIKKDNSIDIINVEFPSGAPPYLNYILDGYRMAGYKSKYGTKRKITSITIADNQLPFLLSKTEDIIDVTTAFSVCISENIIAVAIMSDGISSFVEDICTDTSRTEQPIAIQTVVEKILKFKAYNGVFVQRRAKRFIKDCRGLKWQNTDDMSLGVIYTGE